MRILLISVNREKMPYPVFPLGLAYIASVLRGDGHQLRILDLCFCEDVEQEMKAEISRWGPDLIGLSLRNLDNLTYPTSLSYLPELEEVVIQAIEANAPAVADFKAGKESALKFLVEQVMKATRGRANPQLVNELMKAKLEGE